MYRWLGDTLYHQNSQNSNASVHFLSNMWNKKKDMHNQIWNTWTKYNIWRCNSQICPVTEYLGYTRSLFTDNNNRLQSNTKGHPGSLSGVMIPINKTSLSRELTVGPTKSVHSERTIRVHSTLETKIFTVENKGAIKNPSVGTLWRYIKYSLLIIGIESLWIFKNPLVLFGLWTHEHFFM